MKNTKIIPLPFFLTVCLVFITCKKESMDSVIPLETKPVTEQVTVTPETKPVSKLQTVITPGMPATSRTAAANSPRVAPKPQTAASAVNANESSTVKEESATESTTGDVECDPCNGEVITEPQTITRLTGEPATVTRLIPMSEESDVCITVTVDRISSAWIIVDGEVVFTPAMFNQTVTTLQTVTHWNAGGHSIVVRTAGKPGGTVTISVKGCITQPPRKLCSEVAAENCRNNNKVVVAVYPEEGILYCTDGREDANNCDHCGVYGIYMWRDGASEHYCPADDTFTYTTLAGHIYGGHTPCICGDNLIYCGNWDMQNCIPD